MASNSFGREQLASNYSLRYCPIYESRFVRIVYRKTQKSESAHPEISFGFLFSGGFEFPEELSVGLSFNLVQRDPRNDEPQKPGGWGFRRASF